jgi:hypothetical protein
MKKLFPRMIPISWKLSFKNSKIGNEKIINDNINADRILYKNKDLKLYRTKQDKNNILSIINKI